MMEGFREGMMSTKPEDLWTKAEDSYLERMWGYMPRKAIADALGRSEVAITVRRKRLKIEAISDWPHVLTNRDLHKTLGIDQKTALNWVKDGLLPTITLYRGNTPVPAVEWEALCRWVQKPSSWVYLPIEKITHPSLRELAKKAQAKHQDEWLVTGQVVKQLHVCQQYVSQLRDRGLFPSAVKRGNWRYLRSEVMLVKRIREQGAQAALFAGGDS
jgi:hypothetical protein